MPRTIAHRELRNNSSQILSDVEAGETIAISNHGEVVAYLVPPQRSVTSGLRSRPARKKGGWDTLPRVRSAESVQHALDDLRGER
jgi:prevent-host-death family protein